MGILEKAITDEMVGEKINELKPHHLVLAAILERVHEMNLEETIIALVVIEGLRWLLKISLPDLRFPSSAKTIIATDSFASFLKVGDSCYTTVV